MTYQHQDSPLKKNFHFKNTKYAKMYNIFCMQSTCEHPHFLVLILDYSFLVT